MPAAAHAEKACSPSAPYGPTVVRRMKVFLAREEREAASREQISMEGGARSGSSLVRSAMREVSLEEERPAMAHFRVEGRCAVMYWAV